MDSLTARIWSRLKTPLTSERFDDTVHFAGVGMLVLAVSTFILFLTWKDLAAPGALVLGLVGALGGLTWLVAGWAIWTRKPWASWYAAIVLAFALVCQIVFIGPWKFWTLVLAVSLVGWVAEARSQRPRFAPPKGDHRG